jgi:hypothetical protein
MPESITSDLYINNKTERGFGKIWGVALHTYAVNAPVGTALRPATSNSARSEKESI